MAAAAESDFARWQRLRRACTTIIPGHFRPDPPTQLRAIADWVEQAGYDYDSYGEGALIADFERKIAKLLGMQAAVFMVSGKMASQVAMRIWSERAGCDHIVLHPTAHLELHEERGYAHLHGLRATLAGAWARPFTAEDLAAVKDRVAAAIVELPIREAGGKLPTWAELSALKRAARTRGVRLHLDGARLWESRARYGKTYAAICRGFDSVYVSFYKGIGGLAGSMLLGDAAFIAEARVWQQRHGGGLYSMLPMVASAAMQFDRRIAAMPKLFQRTQQLVRALAGAGHRVEPDPPHANMLHLHLPFVAGALLKARDALAVRDGVWVAQRLEAARIPGWSVCEWYVGDQLLAMSDAAVLRALDAWLALARAHT